jgi:hypothetical protein
MTCSECDKPVLAKGLCKKHYTRLRNHGSVDTVLSPRGQAQAFLASAKPVADCILWPFKSRYASGYGVVSFNGKTTGAHRASCELHNGPPPSEGHEAAHSCGNKLCVNPAHLRWATPSENAADKELHGTSPAGERNGCAKLTAEKAAEIRRLRGSTTQEEIARRFGVSRRAVGMILNNQTWKAA